MKKLKIADAHFNLLNVTRNSTKEEIKKGYRMAINKWHPDKFANYPEILSKAQEMTKKINEAFSLLENYVSSPKFRTVEN